MDQNDQKNTKPFKVNNRVWLDSKNLKIPYQSRKLAPKREGPFKNLRSDSPTSKVNGSVGNIQSVSVFLAFPEHADAISDHFP